MCFILRHKSGHTNKHLCPYISNFIMVRNIYMNVCEISDAEQRLISYP